MKQNYAVGDNIVDFCYLYEITSIDSTPKNGESIHFKPIKSTDKVFTASIPAANLAKAGMRKVLTPKESDQLLKDLQGPAVTYNYNSQIAKEEIYQNIPQKLIPLLKYFWLNKSQITNAEKELLDQLLTRLAREISFVTKKPPQEIKKKIEAGLG